MAATAPGTDPLPVDPTPIRRPPGRRGSALGVLWCVGIAAVLLVLTKGESIRTLGEEMKPGPTRTVVLAVGRPAAWLADRLPLADAANRATDWLSPDDDLGGAGDDEIAAVPVQPEIVPPGAPPPPPRPLKTVLVTGDSLAMPLDADVARALSGRKVRTVRDAHVGTGISKPLLVDWLKLAPQQARKSKPDATVIFIGANDGFPMPTRGGGQVACCGAPWVAEYADRVRRMMAAYRQDGRARVYWLTVPIPRSGERAEIARAVNAAIEEAATTFAASVRVLDLAETFTPGGRFRDSMDVGGRDTIVRESDGIHLNEAGSRVAAGIVLDAIRADFGG